VHGDVVGARGREVLHVALWALDHEMDVEQGVDVAQRGHRRRAHRERGHEVAVHDVDVDDLRAGVDDGLHLLAQAAEVRRKDRGGDPARHISTSIEPSQLLQVRMAVLDMRTMVECSPQSGHTERSSKRCRQLTQR
jgi:hypothetical protein